jgi:hypothetical protein
MAMFPSISKPNIYTLFAKTQRPFLVASIQIQHCL